MVYVPGHRGLHKSRPSYEYKCTAFASTSKKCFSDCTIRLTAPSLKSKMVGVFQFCKRSISDNFLRFKKSIPRTSYPCGINVTLSSSSHHQMVICQRNVNNTISKLQFLPRFVWYISYGNWLPSGNRGFELFPFNSLFNDVRKNYVSISASSGDLSSVRWPCNFVDASCSWFVQRMGPTWKVSK